MVSYIEAAREELSEILEFSVTADRLKLENYTCMQSL
jgi:hypothetical protein